MAKTTLLIDGHVHLYPIFDLVKAVEKGRENLFSAARRKRASLENAVPVWLLVERSDAHVFEELANSPEKFNRDNITFKKGNDNLTIVVEKDSQPILYIFAGRQLITSEDLEVCSLISDLNLADKEKPMDEVIQAVRDSGGIPALNWAPGKWFFNRGKVIAEQIDNKTPHDFFIGETTMRHTLWPKPKLIKKAEDKGFCVLCGSDPLPFPGEEKGIGSFGFMAEGEFDPKKPAQSLRNLLADRSHHFPSIGSRNNFVKFTIRQYKIMQEKKTRDEK